MISKIAALSLLLSTSLSNVVAAPVEGLNNELKRDDSQSGALLAEILSIALEFLNPSDTALSTATDAVDSGLALATTTVTVTVTDDSADSLSTAFLNSTSTISVDFSDPAITSDVFGSSAFAFFTATDSADIATATDSGLGNFTDSSFSTATISADISVGTADPNALPSATDFGSSDPNATIFTDPSAPTADPNATATDAGFSDPIATLSVDSSTATDGFGVDPLFDPSNTDSASLADPTSLPDSDPNSALPSSGFNPPASAFKRRL